MSTMLWIILGVIIVLLIAIPSSKKAGTQQKLSGFEPIEEVQMNSSKGKEVFDALKEVFESGEDETVMQFKNKIGTVTDEGDYKFIGWGLNTTTVTYHPGDTITVSDDITLHAIWRINLAQYVTGSEFNTRIKSLTTNNGATIGQFTWALAEPSDSIKDRAVDVSNNEIPIYAWA